MNNWPELGWSETPENEIWKTAPRQKTMGLLSIAKG